jgi:hypothetical protein
MILARMLAGAGAQLVLPALMSTAQPGAPTPVARCQTWRANSIEFRGYDPEELARRAPLPGPADAASTSAMRCDYVFNRPATW